MEIGTNSLVERSKAVLSQDVDESTVLMRRSDGSYYGLEGVSRRIWALISEPIPISELCLRLSAEHDISHECCAEDTLAFIRDLWNERLVVIS